MPEIYKVNNIRYVHRKENHFSFGCRSQGHQMKFAHQLVQMKSHESFNPTINKHNTQINRTGLWRKQRLTEIRQREPGAPSHSPAGRFGPEKHALPEVLSGTATPGTVS